MKLEIGKAYRCENGKRVRLRKPPVSLWTSFEGVADDGNVLGYYDNGDDLGVRRGWRIVAPWGVIEGPGWYSCDCTPKGGKEAAARLYVIGKNAQGEWVAHTDSAYHYHYAFKDDGSCPEYSHFRITGPWVEPAKKYRPLTVVEAAQNFDRRIQYATDEYATGNRWTLGGVDCHKDAMLNWKAGKGSSTTVPLSRLVKDYVWSDTNEPCGVIHD